MSDYYFYVYILTNKYKTVLYVGLTNDLSRRLYEHQSGKAHGFTERYNCCFLVYYEVFKYINEAIHREKEIKKWKREKKNNLINSFNPEWQFLDYK